MSAKKNLGIWKIVAAVYCPIIFWILVIHLPEVQWKYVFESNKTRVARHHKKAEDIGLPGIPYWRNKADIYNEFTPDISESPY